ncbi:E3 ubiquitin-protein ligase MARCHF3-like isoform X1 [Parasteatoda tepidariorum]|uniref:E3 ubiquitin-protein ligase MARCHF3-like isoform X1 n=1 Tax=Parasteatoda tepidariorum TaxID=114398 RepID=UPI001C7299E2|nr:E3 ubiquitin-protein ligase MARCHF3-like isoform X1 [Parasteatoda tepidariorum]
MNRACLPPDFVDQFLLPYLTELLDAELEDAADIYKFSARYFEIKVREKDGTIEYVHGRCLELWLETTEHKKCELCHYLFKTRKVQKSCLEWFVHPVTENYRTKRMEYILAFASFTSSVIVLIWLIWRFLYRILFNSVQEYKLTLHFVSAVILLASILTYALLYIIWTIWCIRTYIHLIEDWRNSQGEVVDMESIELPSITSEDESVAQQDVLTREEV